MLGRLVDVWRSSVARRILLSFVLAAAIPLTVLAGSAYLMVVDQLTFSMRTRGLRRPVAIASVERLVSGVISACDIRVRSFRGSAKAEGGR